MTSELDQLYQDQVIICKGLSLLKVMSRKNDKLLTEQEQERLLELSVIEMAKLLMLEKELENDNKQNN